MHRILPPSSRRRVLWKNGLGTTLELATDAAEPGGDWTWRLSLADVPSRAPFSHFPGIDRHLAVLEGDGMTIERGGRRETVPRTGLALDFAGEEDVVGEPSGAGVRDANLMLDRTRWRGSLEIARVDETRSFEPDATLWIVHRADARGDGRVDCVLDDASFELQPDSTLVLGPREGRAGRATTLVAMRATLVIARVAHAARALPAPSPVRA